MIQARVGARRSLAWLLIAMVGLAGCASGSDGGNAADTGTAAATDDPGDTTATDSTAGPSGPLRIVLPQEPPTLDPCESIQQHTGLVIRANVTESLVRREPDTRELTPVLATEWEQTDETTWTFTLRDGVVFSDGSELTGEDVAASWERLMSEDRGCPGASLFETVTSVDVVDPLTVAFVTDGADPILPLKLAALEIHTSEMAASDDQDNAPVGTGPYAIDEWQRGVQIDLSRNDEYWGEVPAFDAVNYQWREESSVRASMVAAGEADIALALSSTDDAGGNMVSFTSKETNAIRFDGDAAPLDDLRIREAINIGIDREGILASLYGGEGELASQIIPPTVLGHNEELEVPEYAPDEAADLVAEAAADGVDVDLPISFIAHSSRLPRVSELVEVIRSSLGSIGLNVEPQLLEAGAYAEHVVRPFPEGDDARAVLVTHGNQTGDAVYSMLYFEQEAIVNAFGTDELDAAIDEATTSGGDARIAAMEEVMATSADLVQFAPLFRLSEFIAVAPGISYEPNEDSTDYLRVADVRVS